MNGSSDWNCYHGHSIQSLHNLQSNWNGMWMAVLPSSSVTNSMWWLDGLKPISFSARTEHKNIVAGFNPRMMAKFPSSAETESTLTFTCCCCCCPLGIVADADVGDDNDEEGWSPPPPRPFSPPFDPPWLLTPVPTPPDSECVRTEWWSRWFQTWSRSNAGKETIRKKSMYEGKERVCVRIEETQTYYSDP